MVRHFPHWGSPDKTEHPGKKKHPIFLDITLDSAEIIGDINT